jgi:hypothetical protein
MVGFFEHLRAKVEERVRGARVRRVTLRGIPVLVENSRDDIQTSDVLERLAEALALIERYQPWRFAHLRRDLAMILVTRYPCRGAYIPAQRTCITELTFLARRDISAAPVASSIVHEGMHARVHRMGVNDASRTPAREERLCRKAELAFGRALPPALGAPVVERALQSLDLEDADVAPAIDWSEAMRRQQAIDDEAR